MGKQIHVQYVEVDPDLPPTPTSISPLGSPLSPLEDNGAASFFTAFNSPSPRIITSDHGVDHTSQQQRPPVVSHQASASDLVPPASTEQQAALVHKPSTEHLGLPALDYELYLPPLFRLSPDCTTIKSHSAVLTSDAAALAAFIRAQATLPPKPQIHITGRRAGRVDFALKLNLMPLLVASTYPASSLPRAHHLQVVAPDQPLTRSGTRPAPEPPRLSAGEAPLDTWTRRFADDPAPTKTFVFERTVANLDAAWLEARIRSLVADAGYLGSVAVRFPVTHWRVVVACPGVERMSLGGRIAALFSAAGGGAGRRGGEGCRAYEVVRAVWSFASAPRGEGGGARRCAVQSEEEWLGEWAGAIRHAVLGRRHGWVTSEDKFEVLMEGGTKAVAVM